MHYRTDFYSFTTAIVLYALLVPSVAHAYLDAGTGSYLIQMAVALVAGGLFMFKTFWHRMWFVVSRKKKCGIAEPDSRSEEPNHAGTSQEHK